MRTNTPFTQGEFTADYQGVAKDQFLVDKKLGVCRQEVNILPTNSKLPIKGEITDSPVSLHCIDLVIDRMNSGLPETSGACVQLSVSERLNAFLSSYSFSIYISVVLDI